MKETNIKTTSANQKFAGIPAAPDHLSCCDKDDHSTPLEEGTEPTTQDWIPNFVTLLVAAMAVLVLLTRVLPAAATSMAESVHHASMQFESYFTLDW